VEAVLYRYRAGIPWRDLPERFGDWQNRHRRRSRWAKSGVWKCVFQALSADAANEYVSIKSAKASQGLPSCPFNYMQKLCSVILAAKRA
jgi:transposase